MNKTDSVYLNDILKAIENIEEFTHNLTFKDFKKDAKTQFAVFHAFEIIGEAANK